MIDIWQEELKTLAEIAQALPGRAAGGKLHQATLHRWRTIGLGGVRLEAVRVGGVWCTSRAAVQRFLEARSSGSFRPPTEVTADLANERLRESGW